MLSFSNKKVLSTYHNAFLQESKVVRQRELVAHGFTQRPRNIPSRYMWELRSHIQLLADQLNLKKLDLYVPRGFCMINPKRKIATYNYAQITLWLQIVKFDCGTIDYMSIFHKKDYSNYDECIYVSINKFQMEFSSSQHSNNMHSFMTEFEIKIG